MTQLSERMEFRPIMGGEQKPLIHMPRSIIPACDVSDLGSLDKLARETHDVPGIGGYKVGLELAIPYSLTETVRRIKNYTDLPVIYDHQKAGNDIPELGPKFGQAVKKSGADAVILFPFSSPETEKEWIKMCKEEGLRVLVGGHMTHKSFLESEGGFIADSAPERIYTIAAENGVRDFVVPGNKVEYVKKYREVLEKVFGENADFFLYAPGFIAQQGNITETGQVAGKKWHAIVGSAIYKAQDMKAAAAEVASQIV